MRQAGIAALLLGLLFGAWSSGLHEELHPEELERTVRAAGPLGPVLFVGAFALAELVHLPAILFLFAAAVIWPLPLALATAYVGAVAAALFVVFVARFALSDFARRHVVHRLPERLRGLDDRLGEHGLREVVAVRLVTFMLPAAHWVLGVSKARTRDLVLGTAIGLLPGVAIAVVVGQSLVERWDEWRLFVLGGAVLLVAVHLVRRRRRRRATALEPAADGSD
jgi:uncharacterized membrane protein YdjX (TVP38/TMEM64 family)